LAYLTPDTFDWKQVLDTRAIIKSGALEGLSSTKITSNLKEAGLSYRRINMLHDIRRGRSIEFSKTTEAKLKAETWFDRVYEPFREERKMTSAQATDLWRKTVTETWETIEEAKEGAEMMDKYEAHLL